MDYSDFKRDNWFKRDNLRLQTVRLAVSSVESLERTEPVRVDYTFYAQESMENIGLLFEVRDELGNPLAASCLYGLQMKKGENHLTASYDFATLSPGKYSNYFTTVSLGNGGSYAVEDWVPGVQFRIVDTHENENRVEWDAKALGLIQLPDAHLCGEE